MHKNIKKHALLLAERSWVHVREERKILRMCEKKKIN